MSICDQNSSLQFVWISPTVYCEMVNLFTILYIIIMCYKYITVCNNIKSSPFSEKKKPFGFFNVNSMSRH